MKTKTYLIGDPVIRGKIRRVCRTAWNSVVYAFALIGLFAVSYAVGYILNH